ncbi:hypothetical protein JW968_02025 [Candidatus Woesearchaeota archaeon]|nr:hypothetical protein [Candidatus Woesearchaeota archaeon]
MQALVKSVYKGKKPTAERLVEEARKTRTANEPKMRITVKKKMFGKAPEEHTFYLKGGDQVRSIMQLVDKLEGMAEEEFSHHVTGSNNDFANWVEHVFDEKQLAAELRDAKTRMEHQIRIMNHMLKELGVKG